MKLANPVCIALPKALQSTSFMFSALDAFLLVKAMQITNRQWPYMQDDLLTS